jgi:hypothetical protein
MTSTSNEASRLYDGLLRQYVSWMDCDALGGMEKTVEKLLAADAASGFLLSYK